MRSAPVLIIFAIFAITYWVQDHFLIHQDVLSFVNWAQRLQNGGSYASNFFETNPPLIIYLSIPITLAIKFFSWNVLTSTKIYLFSLIALSITLSYYFSEKIFAVKDFALRSTFNILLCSTLLILPLIHFGQREHLLVAFTVPYALCLAARLEKKYINNLVAIITGVVAFLGFALKPFFITIPTILLAYQLYSSKRIAALATPENITLITLLCIYPIATYLAHPDYFHVIIPFMTKYYYASVATPLSFTILTPPAILFWISLAYFLLFNQTLPYKKLNTIFTLALIGSYISYLLNFSAWIYHALPCYILSVFLFLFMVSQQMLGRDKSNTNHLYQCSALLIIYGIISLEFRYFWTNMPLQIIVTLVAFACLYLVLLAINQQYQLNQTIQRYTSLTLSTITIAVWLTIPLTLSYLLVRQGLFYKEHNKIMVNFLNQHAGHGSVYNVSAWSRYFLPSIFMVNTHSASRFPFLWMMPGMEKLRQEHRNNKILDQDIKLLTDMITKDIIANRPKLVFIEQKNIKNTEEDAHLVNYINTLNSNPRFISEWQHYRMISSLKLPIFDREENVEYYVFQRNNH